MPALPDPGASRILVVDDDPATRRALDRILTSKGYTVRVATDGEDALRILEQESFDLAILDYIMPGVSGAVVGMHLRERWPSVRIIYSSGYAQIDDSIAATSRGTHFIAKPVDAQKLVELVRRVLGGAS